MANEKVVLYAMPVSHTLSHCRAEETMTSLSGVWSLAPALAPVLDSGDAPANEVVTCATRLSG